MSLHSLLKPAFIAISALLLPLTTPLVAQEAEQKTTTPQPFLKEPDTSKKWILDPELTDDFNAPEINSGKWHHRLAPWGERAWTPENVFQKDGNLIIKATYEPHTDKKGREYFYKFGILQSSKRTTYGYFETRIKGCSRFPGLCPAFWLYSTGGATNPKYPHVTYSEIDIVEMLQNGYEKELKGGSPPNQIDCNLHTRIIKDGKEIWQRPQHLPDLCKHSYMAPWDPRDDFHIYACENTPEKITWYIDGIKVAEAENLYWHLPMTVTFTMEARPPLIAWAGEDGREPVPENATPEGFPTHMEVDYVRCWTRE
ncbi:kappa-carrageenase [Luteolibacter algae]|uniref:Kappa-carrageenase n=1 Tax=Luteolibacter algae TaxID=454151 RepID=A0ABW5D5K7_9BACT